MFGHIRCPLQALKHEAHQKTPQQCRSCSSYLIQTATDSNPFISVGQPPPVLLPTNWDVFPHSSNLVYFCKMEATAELCLLATASSLLVTPSVVHYLSLPTFFSGITTHHAHACSVKALFFIPPGHSHSMSHHVHHFGGVLKAY